MLTARKMITLDNTNNIIKLHENELEKYLVSFDIAHDTFESSLNISNHDRITLKRYYDANLQKANALVIDGEFVGKSYDNLDIIENKLVMKK